MAAASLPLAHRSADRVIWLIAFGHFFAHLNILVLPPLFPVLREAYGVGYFALGAALAVLNVTTMLSQTAIGSLVDRLGAAPILIAGHMAFAAAVALTGLLPWYAALLPLMIVAGLGNAVYHPADYAILSANVPRERLGRAFGIHTFGGYLGFAAAPVATLGLGQWIGWQAALMVIGGAGLVLGLVLVRWRPLLETRPVPGRGGAGGTWQLLRSAPVLWALVFFTLLAMAGAGISSFSVAVLGELEGFSPVEAGVPLTAFLVGTALGVLGGGWAADRTSHHGAVVAACFIVVAAVAALLAAVRLGLPLTVLVLGVAGIASGFVSPSRDMLVKKVTPAGASGRVFGFVTIGFNIGGFIAPPLFGFAVDHGMPAAVFWLVAGLSLLSLVSVLATSAAGRHAVQPAE
ncbi:MAG: MFS transporter [Geminicoccaceae bacterium]